MLVSGGEALRTEVVLNINSETFCFGGALRIGDYKLVIELKDTVHNAVAKVKARCPS